jgi:hypothetical protein
MLKAYKHATDQAPRDDAAYGRVRVKLERSPTRLRWYLALAATALAVPILFTQLASRPGPTTKRPLLAPPEVVTAEAPPAQLADPTLHLDALPTRLPTGKVQLPSGVTATLADDTAATARFADGTLDIALATGSIDVNVHPRAVGQAVLLTSERFHFTVVGTAFTVSNSSHRLALTVREGLVSVSREADHLATVLAGENWSARLPSESPHPRGPAPRLARRPAPEDCQRFLPEQTPERLACYREKVRKGGPAGERAQNAMARYLRDDVVDLTAALNAFEAQRARFPRGELKPEADRAIIGLLPRLGMHAEALVETQSFLDAQPDAEDRAEIRLLRGDIYRSIFRDVMRAEKEYDEGALAQGRTGDDSRFLHALCLEALGRVDEARVAYQAYLSQAGTAHAREAQRRMEKLAR